VISGGGDAWLTSVPGAREMEFQALVGSPIPDRLESLGWVVTKIGESERIIPRGIRQRFETSSSGALIPATEGSTRPTSVIVTNAGVAVVEVYDLRMP
jgi:hypothetical protein